MQVAASIGMLCALIAATLYCCWKRKDLAFYILAFFAFLLPYLNVVYIGIWVADRYLYLASFCALAVAATLARDLCAWGGRSLRFAVGAGAIAFALFSGIQTVRQQDVWRDSRALWLHEAYLKEPSLMGIQALAKSYLVEARRESDAEAREALLAKAEHETDRGFARNRALKRRPSPYRTTDQLHLARLHYVRGRIAELRGAPLTEQLGHYRAGFEIAPDPASAIVISNTYIRLANEAEPESKEQLMRKSFSYFLAYVQRSHSDPLILAKNRGILEMVYANRFPFLEDEIAEARRTYFND